MATVGEAIAATLIAQWSALGGAQPDPIQYLVERPEKDPNPTVADAIYVWLPLRRTFDPIDVAEVYRNVTYTLRIVCHTKTSSARQLEIENEVDRILNSGTVITGATRQRVTEINDISNRSYSNLPKYISEVIMEVFTAMEVSATAYGTATATTITTDELIVNTSVGGILAELLMFGSANAAWVNCPCEPAYSTTWIYNLSGWITNTGVNNPTIVFSLPLSTNRGGLKLYISGVRVGIGDADAAAYVENTFVYGFSGATRTELDLNTTDLNTADEHEDTFAAVDCSAQTAIKVILGCEVDAANELDIGYVAVRCYYAA